MSNSNPASAPPFDDAAHPLSRILDAARYLEQCRRTNRSFAVVTADSAAAVRPAIDQFVATMVQPVRVARLPAPTDSSHMFLEVILAQLGFESFASTADDLLRLLTVVMRQGSDRNQSICIVVEDAQDFGPRVFEMIRELARGSRDQPWAPLFVLAGSPGLLRVLDSRGMSSVAMLTRHRFDISATSATPISVPTHSRSGSLVPELVLSLNQDILQRFPVDGTRVLIGRGPHCDICIRSRFVSRQHALLIRSADGDWLVDLKSTNGTSVNSQLVTQRRLVHNDVVSLGNHRLRYLNSSGSWIERPGPPGQDQLSETMVMRSLQSTLTPADAATPVTRRDLTAA